MLAFLAGSIDAFVAMLYSVCLVLNFEFICIYVDSLAELMDVCVAEYECICGAVGRSLEIRMAGQPAAVASHTD